MSVRGFRAAVAAGCLGLCGMVSLVDGSSAWAVSTRVLSVSPAPFGSFANPLGVAVDNSGGSSAGDVYVADTGAGQLVKFSSGGQELERWGRSVGCAGAVELGSPSYVAVSAVTGDVYVSDLERGTVTAFSAGGVCLFQVDSQALPAQAEPNGAMTPAGVAVSPLTGDLLVADRTNQVIDSFNGASGEWEADFAAREESSFDAIAANTGGDVYVVEDAYQVSEYGPSGEPLGVGPLDANGPQAVAVDQSDNHVLVGENAQSPSFQIAEYTEAGGLPLLTFARGAFPGGGGSYGIAVSAASDEVYVSGFAAGTADAFGPVVIVPEASTGPIVEPQAEGAVTLTGTVTPGGEPVTSCVFEYATEAQYAASASYGKTTGCEQAPGSGQAPVQVSAKVTVTPGTLYHYRLTAANANGPATPGADRTFTTVGRPQIQETSVTDVSSDGATLNARIDPELADTTYRFEYGTSTAYGTSIPVPDGDIGAGPGPQTVSQRIQGLTPGTTYHYRVLAANTLNSVGPDHTFTTQPTGTEFALPDNRQYELVSPPAKHGGEVLPLAAFAGGGIAQASEDGNAATYLSLVPFEENPPDNSTGLQYLSTREAGGWTTQDITAPSDVTTGPSLGDGSEYKAFSLDLSRAIEEPLHFELERRLSPEQPEEFSDVFLWNKGIAGFQPLVTNSAPNTEGGAARLVGGSPDLEHIVFSSPAALAANAQKVENSSGGGENLYEWEAGSFRLVNVLPNGKTTVQENGQGAALGLQISTGSNTRNAVSSDGTRVIWSYAASPPTGGYEQQHVYESDMTTGRSVQLDAPQGGSILARNELEQARFATASADGSRVFFTSDAPLTGDANTGPPCGFGCKRGGSDLYVYDADTGTLSDLTPDRGDVDGAAVQGVLGASEDGSYVYFVASGVLAAGAAPGNCVPSNPIAERSGRVCSLYVAHFDGKAWVTKFIATLSSEDYPDYEGTLDFERTNLGQQTSRVSPSGRYLAFVSLASPTGYDNVDSVSDQPDTEVYVYDAEAGRLLCASCNPTGARPTGQLDKGGVEMDRAKAWGLDNGHWVSALVPGWAQWDNVGKALHQPRYLSDRGRLFFDSAEALVPQDTNGRDDVYEYEPDGVGSCREGAGCVYLISGGTGASDAVVIDASASGGDVFFATKNQPVSQDTDNARDMYDAHVCSEASPCLAAAVVAPPACTNVDACKPGPTPQPSIFGAPASATFSGPGNPVQEAFKPAVRSKGKRRATGAGKHARRKNRSKRHRRSKHKRSRAKVRSAVRGSRGGRGR
jgi:hypothetical protein